jgi:hypothetical protein
MGGGRLRAPNILVVMPPLVNEQMRDWGLVRVNAGIRMIIPPVEPVVFQGRDAV